MGFTMKPSISPWPPDVPVSVDSCVSSEPRVDGGGGDWLQSWGSEPMTMPRTPSSSYSPGGGEGSSFMVMSCCGGVRGRPPAPPPRYEDVLAGVVLVGSEASWRRRAYDFWLGRESLRGDWLGGMEEMRSGISGGPCMWRPPSPDSRTDMLGDRFGAGRYGGTACFVACVDRDALAEWEVGFTVFFRLDAGRVASKLGVGG